MGKKVYLTFAFWILFFVVFGAGAQNSALEIESASQIITVSAPLGSSITVSARSIADGVMTFVGATFMYIGSVFSSTGENLICESGSRCKSKIPTAVVVHGSGDNRLSEN